LGFIDLGSVEPRRQSGEFVSIFFSLFLRYGYSCAQGIEYATISAPVNSSASIKLLKA
jgi:hypothetical protein